jgi:hypothetical protein
MRNEASNNSNRSPVDPAQWRADMMARIRYLVLDMVAGMALVSYQAAHTPGANVTLLLASVVVLLTVVDLLLMWKRLPHRLLTIVIYACLVAVVISGFFTGIGIQWAIINGLVFFLWAGMYESARVTVEERPTT